MRREVEPQDAGARLDVWLSGALQITRARAEKLIAEGLVLVEGRPAQKAGLKLKAGHTVEAELPPAKPLLVEAQDIDLLVVYEDRDLAVVVKPKGMVAHPAAGNPDGTLVNALLHHLDGLSGIGGVTRPGIVHRIDKDTSGLLLVAKNDFAHLHLSEQLRAHQIDRAYLAIVQGNLKNEEGEIHAPIGRHPQKRKQMAVVAGGREAHTRYKVLERLRGACLIQARLTTGRTHQIRVHMASIGHPVLGDGLYGPQKPPYPVKGGQLLHAYRLGFVHPRTGETLCFEAPVPEVFEMWHKKLKNP